MLNLTNVFFAAFVHVRRFYSINGICRCLSKRNLQNVNTIFVLTFFRVFCSRNTLTYTSIALFTHFSIESRAGRETDTHFHQIHTFFVTFCIWYK